MDVKKRVYTGKQLEFYLSLIKLRKLRRIAVLYKALILVLNICFRVMAAVSAVSTIAFFGYEYSLPEDEGRYMLLLALAVFSSFAAFLIHCLRKSAAADYRFTVWKINEQYRTLGWDMKY